MLYNLYKEYTDIAEGGDTSSPAYWTARSNYEDELKSRLGFGLSWEQAAAFAASMLFPTAHNIEMFRS